MADSSAVKAEDKNGKVVVLRPGSALTREIARTDNLWYKNLELFDVPNLVLDSEATRSDLRIIEESDDEVQQCVETRLDTLVGVDWRLEGGSESVRDWLTEELSRHYTTLVENAWKAKLYGYSVQERIWVNAGGYWRVDRLAEKPFEWFVPKRDGTLVYRKNSPILLLPQTTDMIFPYEGQVVDTNFKFSLTKHKPSWKNPRGVALLAYLFWPWFYRKATWQFWLQFLERNGQPLLVGKGPDPAQMAVQLAAAVQDAVIAVPKEAEVDAIDPSNRGEAFGVAEDRLTRRIQKILLGQTLTSDVATKGSGAKSLGEVHDNVRYDKTVSDVNLVRPTVQNFVDALVALNFPSSRQIKVVYNIERGLEQGRAQRDATLMNTGQISFTQQYYEREYGFKDGDIVLISVKEINAKSKANEDKPQDKPEDTNDEE